MSSNQIIIAQQVYFISHVKYNGTLVINTASWRTGSLELRHELYCDNKVISKVQCFTRKASFFFEKLREWLAGSPSVTLLATFRSH